MSLTQEEIQELMTKAHEAKEHSYSPYSKFRVGAALKSKSSGKIYTGVNVENSSYGLTICAERTALVKAISEGERSFSAIAVTTDVVEELISPCGACRQCIIEWGELDVILFKPDRTFKVFKSTELLPLGFTPKHLDLAQTK